ncbi:hypothetical protein STEG23_015584 [Scotinomys teguina]
MGIPKDGLQILANTLEGDKDLNSPREFSAEAEKELTIVEKTIQEAHVDHVNTELKCILVILPSRHSPTGILMQREDVKLEWIFLPRKPNKKLKTYIEKISDLIQKEFGRLKYIYHTTDTYSGFQWATPHQKSSTLSHEMSGLNWKPFVYGGLASIVAEFGTFPVDLTKTRLQVQGQSIDVRFKEIKYRGMFHALFRIYKEEGILALYSGIAPALLRQASYGTIKIGIYQSLKRLFVERLEDETLLINMICGVVSGVISSTIANPTDVLKIRMQAQGSLFQGSMIGSFIDIYQQEGTRGLWRGVVPTAQRAAIVVGVELPVYDITKKHLILSGMLGDTILTHFVSSFTCGLAGALASNPVDVVRTRMMNQRAIVGHVDLYKGTLDGILKMWKHEGFFALYKGFWPNWLRLGPWNIIASKKLKHPTGDQCEWNQVVKQFSLGGKYTFKVTEKMCQVFFKSECLRWLSV